MRFFKFFSIFLVVFALGCYLFAEKSPYQTISGATMGTYYNIKIKTNKENKLLSKKINEKLKEINKEMSIFDPQSEISRINNAPKGVWIELSPHMAALMRSADTIYNQSGGAFDPTVGRLVDLWGFGKSGPRGIPSDEEIKNVLKDTGFDKIKFSSGYSRLQKKRAETYIDLSAIAKGYGADIIAALLEEEGYRDFVVEIGGEVVARGRKSDEVDGWNIGVVRPGKLHDETPFVVALKNFAVATSGDYRNFFYQGDRRYSHTISPQTGRPVEHGLASVTVFHDSCMHADAIATAIMVLGEDQGLHFADRHNLPVILFVREKDDKIKTLLSGEAKKLLGV